MKDEQDAMDIIAKAYEQMKEEGVASYRGGKPNLSELARRSGISRKKVERLFNKGKRPGAKEGKARRVIAGAVKERAEALLRSGVDNSSVVFDRLVETGYKGSLSSVKNFIRDNRDLVPAKRELKTLPQGRIRRYDTAPGKMYQMDWGFVDAVDWSGDRWRCSCFAVVCHHCGMRYVEFFPNARQENLFVGMIHAFSVMGVPETVLTDNMASVTIGRDATGKVLFNHEYDDFQHAVGFETMLCKARHPWTKGAVERLVRFVKENFIQGRSFMNVTDLNEQALEWCHKENSRMQKGLGFVPEDEHGREVLKTLPDDGVVLPFLAPERSITLDGFVFYEGRRYGVPFSYIGRKVRVMRSGGTLFILDPKTFTVLEEHAVDWSNRPHYSVSQFEPLQPEELPTSKVKDTIEFSKGGDDDGFSRFDF